MFMLKQASEPTLCYQATRGAPSTARRLTVAQRFLLTRCDGRATLANLAQATRLSAEEVSDALNFLRAHGLVRVVLIENTSSHLSKGLRGSFGKR